MDFSWFKRLVIERSHASFRTGSIWRIKFKTILMHCTDLVRFAVSQEVLKHLRWHFASYAGRSSKQTPSFILNLVSFFTLHCFLSLFITLWYCMVISLVSPRGGFRMQKKLVTNFCKIDTIYNKVIALIFVVIVVVIIIIANVAILFCFEIFLVTSWYMPMLVASEILWSKI